MRPHSASATTARSRGSTPPRSPRRVAEYERIESALVRPLTYAHLVFATNMADPARGALVARLGEKAASLDTQLLFFGLEWAAVEDDAAEALLVDPALDHWRHHLQSLRKFRPYLLSEPEEQIVTEKTVSGSSAWSRLYEELLGAMRVTLDGEEVAARAGDGDAVRAGPRLAPRRRRGDHGGARRQGSARARSCSTRSCWTSRSTTGCAATRPGSRRGTSRTRRRTRRSRR